MCVSRACVPCGHACMAAACHTGRPGLATDQPFPSSHLPCVVVASGHTYAFPTHQGGVQCMHACAVCRREVMAGPSEQQCPPDRRLMNLRSVLSLQAPAAAASTCTSCTQSLMRRLRACWASCRRWVVLSKLSAARHTQRRASEKSRARATATRPRGF